MSKSIRTAWLSDVVDLIDEPDTNRIVCHGKEFALVKRGHWIYEPKDAMEMMFTLPKCSECGHESADALNYCPNCGADMREVEDGRD